MPKIYLIMDYSAGANWLYSTLAHNREILEAHGFDFAPFDSDDPERVPWHMHLWDAGENWKDKGKINSKIEAVNASLQKGRNVMILGRTVAVEAQRKFFDFIHKNVAVKDYEVVAIMCFGKPALRLESWWFGTPAFYPDEATKQYMVYATHLSTLSYSALDYISARNLKLLPFLQDTVDGDAIANNCQKVFEILGIDEKPQIPAPLPFYGFTFTATGKRLFEARKVRHNDWPRLDNFGYMSILHELEKKWRPEPLTSLAYRKEFLQTGKADQAKLENLLQLPAGALDAPAWYGEVEGLPPDAPLDPEKVRAFANALPQSERDVLLTRFNNDRRFLTGDQKLFADILAEMKGVNFENLEIGEPAPLLTVLTMTRNHEKYIGECIEGVLAQKTDFPVRHLVLDHYSTDATPEIVNKYAKEYPSIRPVLLNDCHWAYNNVRELLSRCDSEYVALCDGDDYFTSPKKLQRQVYFLKANPQCSLVFHPVEVRFEDGQQSFFFPPIDALPGGKVKNEYNLSDLVKGNFIQTNSVVYRWRFREGLPEWFRDDVCPGDWYWHLLHAEVGSLGFLRTVMSVYRRHAAAAFSHAFFDPVEHSRKTGMASLNAYKIYNDHFKGQYFLPFGNLAAGVFSDFTEILQKENDSTLLDEASLKYPEFARYFLYLVKKEAQKDNKNSH